MTQNLNTCFIRNKSNFNEYVKSLCIVQLPVGKNTFVYQSAAARASKCRVNFIIFDCQQFALYVVATFQFRAIPFREIHFWQINGTSNKIKNHVN